MHDDDRAGSTVSSTLADRRRPLEPDRMSSGTAWYGMSARRRTDRTPQGQRNDDAREH